MSFNRRVLRFIQGGLLLLCLSFSGFTIHELAQPYRLPSAVAPPPEQPEPDVDATMETTVPDVPPLAGFAEIIERPLFMENRKPAASPSPATTRPVSGPETLEQVRLSAIVISGEETLALVYTDHDRKLQRLRPGEVYKGWTLTDIEANSIYLKQGERVTHVPLVVALSRRAAPQTRREPADAAIEQQGQTEQP